MAEPAGGAAPGRVLVINVSRIGDTLLATPAIRALAEAWPDARLEVLAHPRRFEVLQHLSFVANCGAITKQRARLRGWLGVRRWDLAVVYGFDRALVAYALRVANRVAAFRQGDASLDARLAPAVDYPPPQSRHAVDYAFALTRALGVPDAGRRLAYRVTEDEKSWARARLAGENLRGKPLVGLQIASFPTKGYRDWPLEHFAQLAQRIAGRWPEARFLLFGGALERSKTAALASLLQGKAVSFAGRLRLRESAALMNELDLYVGVDTGPTHIMGALEAPMVALYHCHSPSRLLAPLERPRCYAVDHPRAAQGCGPETPMAELGVDAVWDRVQEALAGR